MAKKKRASAAEDPLLSRSLMGRMDKKTEGTADATVVGFNVPFSLQYLIDSELFPFGCTVTFNALQMSCKSMLCFEMGRMMKPYYGWLDYIIGEGKWSESLGYAVIGWATEDREMLRPHVAKDLSEMQSHCTDAVNRLETLATKGFEGSGPLGYHCGMVVAMDSIGGVNSQSRNENIEAAGSAQREYSSEALHLTNYLKNISNKIQNLPVVLILVRHRKEDPGPNQYSMNVRKSGGKHVGFQATYDIGLSTEKHKRTMDSSPMGSLVKEQRHIRMVTEKNSLGSAGRQIKVRVSWQDKIWPDPGDGRPRVFRVAKWHWEEATVALIENWLENKPGYGDAGSGAKRSVAGRAARFQEFFHIERVISKGKKYWSKTLGMSKSDAVPAHIFGRYIEENRDAKEALRLAFGIKAGAHWNPKDDYMVHRKKYMEKAMQREQQQFSRQQLSSFMHSEEDDAALADELSLD